MDQISFSRPCAQSARYLRMPHFFMHLRNSVGFLPDPEGVEADSVEEARQLAVESIRSLLADELARGRLDLRGSITIADHADEALMVVPFDAAVEVIGPGPAS